MKKLMAANWKMYKTRPQAQNTITELCEVLHKSQEKLQNREVLIFSPFTALDSAVQAAKNAKAPLSLAIGAQNFYPKDEGAFTGEISLPMLKDVDVNWVLVGHSERRTVFGESLEIIQEKAQCALQNSFNVTFCVGESLSEREGGKLESVLSQQLEALKTLSELITAENFAVAYEPVWAIGTGKVAGPAEVVEAHALVRKILENILADKGKHIRILYGGSVKADNAGTIINLDNVDGVLVGGASLQAESFASIVTA